MKLHHLAGHQPFTAGSNQQRKLSPLTRQQQTASMQQLKQHQQVASSMSDEEEEEEFTNEPSGFYESTQSNHQHQQLHQQHHQLNLDHQHQQMGQHSSSTNHLDSNGFLIDKNKKLFPQKLWELIHNPSIQHCLRWSQDGQRVYLNRNEFEAYYLKTPNNQFHTQKAISFVRQMNMYGFRKVDDCYYENDNFRRDRQHLLRNMIRRHPNKGLFVGLDHHQLAAAAAAQQAIQVNQQLQQLEHQHKHRTEQALRLNSYLNSHQFHQSAAMAAHHHHQLQHSSAAAFKQMSSQLVAQAVAANHLSQQQLHHQHLQHLHHHQQQPASTLELASSPQPQQHQPLVNHQPKKSRVLNNFYASNSNATSEQLAAGSAVVNGNALANQQAQLIHSPDSMHSTTSSVDTQPSQCSSLVNSGSAGSPQPAIGSVVKQNKLANSHQSPDNLCKIRHQSLKSLQSKLNGPNEHLSSNTPPLMQTGPTDLSASGQALHQTLVLLLLQLKNQDPQDLLASLQQQQQHQNSQRSILESLASLSSVGTGSNVDPASNSPTEQTSTPPSTPSSPRPIEDHSTDPFCQLSHGHHFTASSDDNSMVLNLTKSSSNYNQFNGLNNISASLKQSSHLDCHKDMQLEEKNFEKNCEDDETEVEEDDARGNAEFPDEEDECAEAMEQEVSKKIRSHPNNQIQRVNQQPVVAMKVRVKQEEVEDLIDRDEEDKEKEEYNHKRKRNKLTTNSTSSSSTSSSQKMNDELTNIIRSTILEK